MAQTKKKSNVGTIILALVLVLVIAAGIIVLCIPKDEPSKVMQVDINPSCQFVLNKNNRVVSVNCLNDDAQIVLQGTDFVGMTAEQAAQALVKISTEAGYIKVDSQGNVSTANGASSVNITLSVGTDVDTEKLQKSIVDSVNKYFDENGIIYGAICSKVEGFENALNQLSVDAKDFANKTEAEMLELMGKTSKELEGIALENRDKFYSKYNELKKQFDVQKLEDTITKIQAQVNEAQKQIDDFQAKINKVNDMPEGPEKEIAKAGLDIVNDSLKQAKDSLKELNKKLDEAKKNLKDTMKKLEAELDKTIKTLEEESKKVYEEAKKVLQQKYDDTKELLKQHKDYFEQNKEEIKQKIEQYRTKLI